MKLPKAKTLLRYAVITYLVYLIYSIPKKDWSKGVVITETLETGQTACYDPQQSAYIKYAVAWWRNTIKQKGISGITDEYILAPLGINLDKDNESTNVNTTNSRVNYSANAWSNSSGSGYVRR